MGEVSPELGDTVINGISAQALLDVEQLTIPVYGEQSLIVFLLANDPLFRTVKDVDFKGVKAAALRRRQSGQHWVEAWHANNATRDSGALHFSFTGRVVDRVYVVVFNLSERSQVSTTNLHGRGLNCRLTTGLQIVVLWAPAGQKNFAHRDAFESFELADDGSKDKLVGYLV